MAFVRVVKLRTVFFLLATLYLLVALIAIKVFFNESCCTYHLRLNKSQNDFQLLYHEQPLYQNLRKAGVADTAEELDYFLNIRKLILFAVHELNESLKYTKCTKWWANPLDLILHKTKRISTTYTDHLIKFHIQPGNLILEVIIRQQVTTIRLHDKELEIQSFDIQEDFIGKQCAKDYIGSEVAKFCLCDDNEHFDEYNTITNELRISWSSSDAELITWPPDQSYFVTDYMNFTDYEWFVLSPGQTMQDVAELSYSTEYCGPEIKLLVMISSAPGHFEQRRTIRQTYASPSSLQGKGIKVVFVMGVPEDKQLNYEVNLEAATWKDIIQANYKDTYHNLTFSHFSMFKWAHLTCIEGKNSGVTVPEFFMKADDDFILNLDLALQVAQQNREYELMGRLFCNGTVLRELSYMQKYYTPRYMHIANTFAGYVSGVSYMMRSDVIPLLFHMIKTTPTIHMDDVFVMGILVRELGIQPRGSRMFANTQNNVDPCKTRRMIAWYVMDLDDMIEQWNMLVQPMPSNCTLDDLELKLNDLTDMDRDFCRFKKIKN